MEFNIVINQAAMVRWVGKINMNDAAIVGFVRNLTSNDPLVRHYMLNGYFRLDSGWIKRQLPMLNVSEDWIRRSLKKLEDLKLLDCFRAAGPKKRLKIYGRISNTYLDEERRVLEAIDAASGADAEKTPGTGEKSRTRRKLPVREKGPGETPIDHEEDQVTQTSPPPSVGAADVLCEEEELTPEQRARLEEIIPALLGPKSLAAYREGRRARSAEPTLPGIDGLEGGKP